jgi:hypothetical protein
MQEDEHFSDLKLGDIREHWHWVKHGIEEVIKKTEATYIPEDIYAKCVYGEAHLFLNEGIFYITSITTDEFTMKKSFYLWITWASIVHTKKQLDSHILYFIKLAKEQGCSFLEGGSPIDKVGAYLISTGFKPVATWYRKEI